MAGGEKAKSSGEYGEKIVKIYQKFLDGKTVLVA